MVEGDPPQYAGEELFTIAIHHGGTFYSNLGLDKVYKGGEVLYVDGVDADKMTLTELNRWAYDIGYCEAPITFQYKIPGSDPCSGFLPIYKDCHVVDMFALAPKSKRCLDIYICCLAERKNMEELEAQTMDVVDHQKYFGHVIHNLPLEEERVVVEEERFVVEEAENLETEMMKSGEVGVDDVLNDEEFMQQTFGESWENADNREEVEAAMEKRKRRKGKEKVAEVEVEKENLDDHPNFLQMFVA